MKKVPSEFDPASATVSPMVGANCRGNHTDAKGMAYSGAEWVLEDSGRDCAINSHTKNTANTRFTLLRGSRER